MRLRLPLSFAAIVLSVTAFAAEAQAQSAVTFSLDFRALGRHAAWYVALDKGYYKQAGLDVTIIPSQGTAQAIQSVESKAAQFTFSDVAGLVAARANSARDREDGRGDLPEGALCDLLAALGRERRRSRSSSRTWRSPAAPGRSPRR